jgi:hypothetical protein
MRRAGGACEPSLERCDEVADGWDVVVPVIRRCERGEAGGPRRGPRALVEPRHDPIHIDRRGGRDVLQVGFLEPPVPGAPQPAAPDALRESPFDPGSSLLALLALLTAIPRLCRLQRVLPTSVRDL